MTANRPLHPVLLLTAALLLAPQARAADAPAAPAPEIRTPAAPQRPAVRPPAIAVPQAPVLPEMAVPQAAIPPGIPDAPRSELPVRPAQTAAPLSSVPAELLSKSRVTVAFAEGSDALDDTARKALDAIALRLAARPEERLELRAHAPRAGDDESPARRLSLARAKAVREHLLAKGVAKQRLIVFALGSRGEADLDRVDLAFK